jgi:hypothetical protein
VFLRSIACYVSTHITHSITLELHKSNTVGKTNIISSVLLCPVVLKVTNVFKEPIAIFRVGNRGSSLL